ncbi:MAG TPA: biosynthetic-type acetolactate synthase large subunit [Planctomycetota bacterium]|nr:biosynthetic-type acetolactate synthase large subunit [Planctomycetota bacterium]
MRKIGADIFVDALVKEGVEYIFGIPGAVIIPLFDKLLDSPVKLVLTRHEQGAGHAADGYARASGKVGVCIATSGPGATNLVTAIATANFDSVPIVAITGQVRTPLIGNDAFQEADMTGITRTITKHNFLVKDVCDLPRVLKEAFHIARTGRPGPVLVDLPMDVSLGQCDLDYPDTVNLPGYKPNYKGNDRQIKLAAEAINASKRPVLYVGGGVIISESAPEVFELATKASIPVTTTLLGLGAFPETHPLALKMLGMHGTAYANYAVTESDLVIAVGARFDDRVTGRLDAFAPEAKVIHIDIDPTSISKNIRVDIPVVGDAKGSLQALLPLVRQATHPEWLEKIDNWKKQHPLVYKPCGLKPQYVVEQIYEATKGEAVITTEVGQNQMWAAQWFKYSRPRQFISSGGLGTMGFGLPAAIGAQFARPDAVVFDIAGDGSIQMNIQELATAVKYKLPVNIAILNNGFLGMVRQWQELFYRKRYSGTILGDANPDFVKVAEAYGADGIRVTTRDEVRPAIERAIASPRPVILDFAVESEENVFPMVPAGEAINKMMGGMA